MTKLTPDPCRRARRTILGLSLVVVCLLVGGGASPAWADGGENFPFGPGERCVYDLRWGVIPAGQAILSVLPFTEVDGVPAWHFQLTIKTNEFVDIFYRVRDKIDAYAELSLQEFLLYRKSQQEGRTRREEVVRFDKESNRAMYSNHGQAGSPVSLLPGSVDPLTAVYFVRSRLQREHLEIVKPITDGKKNVSGVARVSARESLAVDGVAYETFRVEPDLRGVGGVFEKSRDSRMTLWFTTDARRLLVKIEGKVVVGSFTGTLVANGLDTDAAHD